MQNTHSFLAAGAAALAVGAVCLQPGAAAAESFANGAIEAGLGYTLDVVGPVSGVERRETSVLDNLDLTAFFDLEQLAGWDGVTAFAYALNTSGDAPNERLGTLQGVDNIEVDRQKLRLFELWVEKAWAQGSLRAGLYDLNSEFYSNDAAGLLIAPAFGIGSEIAATGPNGPSIFPSTALAVRAQFDVSSADTLRLAVLNAEAGVLGDPDGVSTSLDSGALVIGEWVHEGPVRLGAGAWTYTDKQDDLRESDALGPLQQRAFGLYLTLERVLWGDENAPRAATGFARLGASDGDTTVFSGGWQAGVLVERVFAGRPDSQASIGLNQAFISNKYQANARDLGETPADAESAIEITYADTIGWLTIQPDLQIIHHPNADEARDTVWVGALRLSVGL